MTKWSLLLLLLFSSAALAQDDLFFEPTTTIGGYGELHYNAVTPDGGETNKTLDFHRFVLFYGHAWTEKWSFKAEVELEHNFVQDGQGELELEQAYVNYHHADWFGFQAGVVLPSAGLLNEYHEPPLFLSVERPDYNKNIIPTTWFGNGAAVYGNYNNFDYKVTVMEGIDALGISASSGFRGGRMKGYKSNANELLYNARVDYLGMPGLRVGASFSTTTATSGDSISIGMSLVEGHLKYDANNVIVIAEYGMLNYDSGVIESGMGYYIDLGYDVAPLIDCSGRLIPFFRYTDYNAGDARRDGSDPAASHISKWLLGVSYLPIPQVAFKADYGVQTVELGSAETTLFNLGVGYMF